MSRATRKPWLRRKRQALDAATADSSGKVTLFQVNVDGRRAVLKVEAHRAQTEALLAELAALRNAVVHGDPRQPGPVVSEYERVRAALAAAQAEESRLRALVAAAEHEEDVVITDVPYPRDQALARAMRCLTWVELFVPKRLYQEEIGDALEVIARVAHERPDGWKRRIAIKVASTIFWVMLNTARDVAAGILGRKST